MDLARNDFHNSWNASSTPIFIRLAPLIAMLALFLFSVGREIGGTSAAWAAVAVANTFLLVSWYDIKQLRDRVRDLEQRLSADKEA